MAIIKKKTWPEHFELIKSGKKNFDLKLTGFKAKEGDILVLKEWDSKKGRYTGREIKKKISYVMRTKKLEFWSTKDIEKYGYQVLGLEEIRAKGFRSPILTVDGMILDSSPCPESKVLLVKRAVYPFSGYWVLPGGHIEYNETAEKAIRREMKEELGIPVKIRKLVGVYSDPRRDPRYHTVSVVYFCQKARGKVRLNREASKFKYFSFKNLPKKIGFDHRKIINDFRKINLE